jgi:hypothetical protein
MKQHQLDPAMRLLQDALVTREQLATRDPKNSGARAEVAESYGLIGDIYMQRRQAARARESYTHAHEIFSELRAAGRLTADYIGESARLATLLQKLKTVS